MEVKNNNSLKYWRVSQHQTFDNVVIVTCPAMNKELPFGVKRAIYKELKVLERKLSASNYYLTGYAKLTDPHIMRMWVKVGASPFYISLKSDRIWFKKRLK